MDNYQARPQRLYGRTPDDLLADTAHNAQIKKFALASLLSAALFVCASAFVYVQTTISYRHTITLLNDTFWLHSVLEQVNRQIEFLFNANDKETLDAGFLKNFKSSLSTELKEAQTLENHIKQIAEIKQKEYLTPIQTVVQRDLFDKGLAQSFKNFSSMIENFLQADQEDLIGGITTWRHNMALSKLRITNQYSELLNNLISTTKKELSLYSSIQMGILISVSGVLLFLWFGVYKPLMMQLRQQHLNAIQSYYDVHHKARQDELTKLANRLGFNEAISSLLNGAKHPTFTLLNFDIDYFKEINDQYGHSAGDDALVQFAQYLKSFFTNSICTARLGGDEFAVITDKIDVANIDNIVKKLTKAIPIEIGDNGRINIKVSVGAATYGVDGTDQKTLLRSADRSLYLHKNANKISAINNKSRDALPYDILRSIDFGIRNNEFYTVFQPIVSIEGNPYGIESLIRWRNPAYKDAPISSWFKVAETSGAAELITSMVLNDTIALYKILYQRNIEPLKFNINVSGSMDSVCHCLQSILNIITQNPKFSKCLVIEFTETIDFEGDDIQFNDLIIQLQEIGVEFAFDDFGSGHATLLNLLSVPINQIKIDHQLIKEVDEVRTQNIINSITGLSNALGLTVVAEGVEYAEQIEYLKAVNCHYIQGNYICKPLRSQPIVDWFVQNCETVQGVQQEAL